MQIHTCTCTLTGKNSLSIIFEVCLQLQIQQKTCGGKYFEYCRRYIAASYIIVQLDSVVAVMNDSAILLALGKNSYKEKERRRILTRRKREERRKEGMGGQRRGNATSALG